MYKRQKGMLPFVSNIFGLFILVYPTFGVLFYSIPKIFTSNGMEAVSTLLATALLLSFPLSIGWLLLFLFPMLKVFDYGIRYMTSPITTRLLTWDNVDFLHVFNNGYGALVIRSGENSLLYGLSINKLYGLITGIIDPVILLSPKTVDMLRKNIDRFSV